MLLIGSYGLYAIKGDGTALDAVSRRSLATFDCAPVGTASRHRQTCFLSRSCDGDPLLRTADPMDNN